MTTTRTLVDGIGWPEGLRWRDGELFYSDVFGRQGVYATDLEGSVRAVAEIAMPSGLGWLPDGELLVVSMQDRALLRVTPDGEVKPYADLSPVARFPNDMTVTADGTAYLGDNGFDFGVETPLESHVIRVPLGGEPEIVADGLGMPNGMVVAPDGRHLLVAETLAGRISQLAIDDEGSLGERNIFHAFDDLGFVDDIPTLMSRPVAPDGICVNAAGQVWVGNPLSTEVCCVDADGTIADRVTASAPGITCALGGPHGRTLFVATGDLVDQAGTTGRIEITEVDAPAGPG